MTKKKDDAFETKEIRLSLFEADADGKHTKHIAVTITDPELLDVITRAVGSRVDLVKADDAHHETIEAKKKEKDAA
jgi:hypothetical protein